MRYAFVTTIFIWAFSCAMTAQSPKAQSALNFQVSLGASLQRESPKATHLALRSRKSVFHQSDILQIQSLLNRVGGKLQSVIGGIATIMIASNQIAALDELSDVIQIDFHSPDEPLSMSVSRGNAASSGNWLGINADSVHSLGYTGKGVLVGVVDDGFDLNNGDFKDASGRTRILFAWNQMTDAPAQFPTNPAYSYGTEWDSAAINSGAATIPNNSHGTNCLGIAAGDGSESGEKGLAPDANLIVVVRKTGAGSSSANTIDAFNYLQKKARALGMPISISYSIGGHSGAHDGTRDQELAIDSLAGNGVLFSTAAGNDRTTGVYTRANILQGGVSDIEFSAINSSGFFIGNAWLEGADSIGASLIAPDGTTVSTVPTDSTTPVLSAAQGTFQLSNEIYAPNGDWNLQWGIRPTAGSVGVWKLRFHGGRVASAGNIDAWRTSAVGNGVWQNPINEKTIVTPSTADSAISVAAFQISDGSIEPSSSIGATRNGKPKPELAAPTGVTTTAGGFGGTSASAPHVAGVGALLLQANPALSVLQFKQILSDSARKDFQTGAIPPFSVSWGNGKLYALGALQSLNPFAPASLSASAITPTALTLSWSGASSEFEARQNGVPIFSGASLSQRVSGLSPNTAYTFSLRGKQTSANAFSPAQISLRFTTPSADTNLLAVATSQTFAVGGGTAAFAVGETGARLQFPSGVTTATSFTAIRQSGAANTVGSLPIGIAAISQDGFWTITASAGSSVGAYSLTLDLSGFGGISNFNSLKVLKRDNPLSAWQNAAELGATLSYNNPFITISGLTSFSDFALASSGDNPLPVTISNFDFERLEASVKLIWQTISERDNAGFEILRRAEEGEWLVIANYQNQPRLKGNGTSSEPRGYSFLDNALALETNYAYKLRSVDFNGTIYEYPTLLNVASNQKPEKARQYALHQNYPNPFNPATAITYVLEEAVDVRLELYDVLGRKIATLVNERKAAGLHSFRLIASQFNLSSGVYIYALQANGFSATRRLLLVK